MTASRCGGFRPASSSSTASACSARGSTSSERRSVLGSAAMRATLALTSALPSRAVPLVDDIRSACAWVAARARRGTVLGDAIEPYARSLEPPAGGPSLDPELHLLEGPLEDRAAFFLTLDAVNFGSGWFPTLRKRDGLSGYGTIAAALRERFATHGAWSARELAAIEHVEVAMVTGQDPGHELVRLWTDSLRALGERVAAEYGGDWFDVAGGAGCSAG